MNYFENCPSVEAAKKRYRELLMRHHPDHAGPEGEAVTKEVIKQFNAFLNGFMSDSFNSYYEDKEWQPGPDAVTPFQDVLKKIIDFDCEIEIIGCWIYCFKAYSVRGQLKDLEFWFSGKHKAWVFSGRAKRLRAGKETLDEIRSRKGSQKVKGMNRKRRSKSKKKNNRNRSKKTTAPKSRFSHNAPACAGAFQQPLTFKE